MSDPNPGFQGILKQACHRMRLQRFARVSGLSLRFAAVFSAIVLIAALAIPQAGGVIWGLVGLGVFFWLVVLLAAWVRPVDEARTVRSVDARLDLPDHTLTSSELPDGEGWFKLQHEDTMSRLAAVDWKKSWPIEWPKFSAAAGVAAVLLGALAAFRLAAYVPPPPVVAEQTGLPEEAAAIEELLKDWDKAAELTDDPELKKLLAELQPMREKLPEMNEREMLTALSKIENKLEALREAAGKESLEANAADMAAAFENVEGMGALSAALRKKDFEKAAKLAEKEAEKLSKEGAQTPQGSDSASAQEQMARAAQKLEKSGQNAAASAMQLAKQGAEKKDAAGMCKGMGQLSQCMAKEAKRQSACQGLGLQLAQIGQCKNGMGQGMGLSLLPKLSMMKGKGKGAGSETDLDREKDPTQIDAARTSENLTGMAGEGESETETMASDTPGGEAPRADRAAQFAQYEKLSEQAIADESLPIAYRETIRKYFEAIRPAEQ